MGAVARPRLFLIDSFGFIFRAYHARARSGAPPMRTSTGLSTEAVYIFNNMLRQARQGAPAGVHGRGVRERRARRRACRSSPSTRPTAPRRRRTWREQIPLGAPHARSHAHPDPRIPGLRGGRRDRHHRAAAPKRPAWRWSSSRATRTCCNWWTSASPCSTRPRTTSWYDPAKVKEFMGVHAARRWPTCWRSRATPSTTFPARRASATRARAT